MEAISMPFSATYGASALEALGSDRLTLTGGAAIVIGNSTAAVEVRGIVRLEGDMLEVEYRATQAQVLGLISTPHNTDLERVGIPLSAVESVRVRRGFFRKPRLIIEFSRLDVIPAIPWSETTRLVLTIERRDRPRAREFAVSLELLLADADLRRLGEN